jgi:1,4-alpha-glucan branching enzyme
MCELARFWTDNQDKQSSELERVIKQAARELMLMSSSDWQFLISTFAARDYAELRLAEHYEDFKRMAAIADKLIAGKSVSDGEWEYYRDCAVRDVLFPELEIEWFAKVEFPA